MTAPTIYHLRNNDGVETFTGTITPPPGGGASPIGCVLRLSFPGSVEVHAAGDHKFAWNGLLNNLWDQGPILAIPDGLGLTFAFDGSDPNGAITVAESGWYAFALALALHADDTWLGMLDLGFGLPSNMPTNSVLGACLVYALPTVYLPAGAQLEPLIETNTPATSNPLTNNGAVQLAMARVG